MAEYLTNGSLTPDLIGSMQKDFQKRPENRIMLNAVTRGSLQELAISREAINRLNNTFSNEVDFIGPISDQKNAGTCWLFAHLNWLKWHAAKKMKVESFEFSQNYHIFWNKIERSNYFLEKMIELADRPWDDRQVYFLLDNPAPDGGDWHMTADIIDKYGLIPKSAMPDTVNREKSRFLNEILYYKLREGAAVLRSMHREGKSLEALRAKKQELLSIVYRIVAIMLGEPPRKFDFGYRDKDKKYHEDRGITPKEFAAKYIDFEMKDIYSLLSCPTPETPYNRTFTADYLANTVDGRSMMVLNVPNHELKRLALEVLAKEEPCLFSSDVRQDSHSKEGLLDPNLYDYHLVFDAPFAMDQLSRIYTLQTRLTHCMVFIGVDLVDGKPTKWKIENSWGEDFGKKGIFIMSDKWFDEQVYALNIHKKYLTPEMLELFAQPPITLPCWHPMV